jgi:molybdopterin molybdotransferase
MADLHKYGFTKTTRLKDVWNKVNQAFTFSETETETILTQDALSRIVGKTIISLVNLPAVDRSAVDGYAVRAEDTHGSTQLSARILKVVGEIAIDDFPSMEPLKPGSCMKVATGSTIPRGADGVIMVENTQKLGEKEIEILSPIPQWGNISRVGEDLRKGDKVFAKGMQLYPTDLGLLLALEQTEVVVQKPPRVGILACGDELFEVGTPLTPGKIIETNRTTLRGYITQYGGDYVDLGIVGDDEAAIIDRLKSAFPQVDILITTGGTSVGEKDFSVSAAKTLGNLIVHGISIRPGMPAAITAVHDKPLLSFSGVPLAAVTEFLVICRPMIQKMLGMKETWGGSIIQGVLNRRVPSPSGIRSFVRVNVVREDKQFQVEPIRTKGANILSTMTAANGFLVIGEDLEGYDEGDMVEIQMFKPFQEELL